MSALCYYSFSSLQSATRSNFPVAVSPLIARSRLVPAPPIIANALPTNFRPRIFPSLSERVDTPSREPTILKTHPTPTASRLLVRKDQVSPRRPPPRIAVYGNVALICLGFWHRARVVPAPKRLLPGKSILFSGIILLRRITLRRCCQK